MPTFQEGAIQQRFRDTRNTLAVILNDLADVAQVREEVLLNGEAEEGLRTPRRQPLDRVLRKRAETVAAQTPFRVAVVGEFSRGKSTLINALLGREILTTDLLPNTATRIVLKYGVPERFRVSYLPSSGRKPLIVESENLKRDLAQYTSDMSVDADYSFLLSDRQKSLAELIQEVEVWCVSDFLKSKEMEIIDTPGLGSVFPAHRAITYQVIPSVDATLFLVQADPGPGDGEITFLRFVREYVNQIFFVLTKADWARSQRELEGMLEFVQTMVEVKTDVQVENLYPVSALNALEGRMAESGFAEFLPALETFLVQSSGVARLQSPLYLAQTHWARLSAAVERDIRALDQNLEFLQAELKRLRKEEETIRSARDKLQRHVDNRIGELMDLATAGMEDLPLLIQRTVEEVVEEMSIKEMLRPTERLQVVMKDTVLEWLAQKEERFRSSTEQLQHLVEHELKSILNSIEASGAEVDYDVSVEVMPPDFESGWWAELGKLFGPPILVSVAGVLAMVLGITVVPTTIALLSLGASLVGIGVPALALRSRLQERIKKALLEPLPDNRVNVYQAIVVGFTQEGEHVPGIRATVEGAYRDWGKQLNGGISLSVNSNLNSRLEQLQRQIENRKGGQLNRERELERYSRQQSELGELGERLERVECIISELSKGEAIAEGEDS